MLKQHVLDGRSLDGIEGRIWAKLRQSGVAVQRLIVVAYLTSADGGFSLSDPC
jgi:hypothetical protein